MALSVMGRQVSRTQHTHGKGHRRKAWTVKTSHQAFFDVIYTTLLSLCITGCDRGSRLLASAMPSLSWPCNALRMCNGLYEPLRPVVSSPRGMGVHRFKTEADREFLGALQRSLALFKASAMIPEGIVKGRIALDGLPTAGTCVPVAWVAELHHNSSSLWLPFVPRRARRAQLPRRAVTAQRGTPVGERCRCRRATITSPSRPRGVSCSGRAAQTGSAR